MRAAAVAIGAFIAAAAAAWLLWVRTPERVDVSHLRSANLLLITIDTLRADRLGAYGGRGGLTPVLDGLAARGVRFERAWSHAPITLPAHASILTGVLPPRHGVRNNGAFRLGAQPVTLAERLREAGYRTGAFVGAFVLDARFGLARGFDVYDDRYSSAPRRDSFHFVERPADRVLQAATDWIAAPRAGTKPPWFAWVHLFDPHAPYGAPDEFRRGRTPYDAEVAWTDLALGAALDQLERSGQLAHTLIAITADHGESLGDHGETTHGLFAYEATLRVPLILAAPGLVPRVVATPTTHVDIAPTVLDLLGLEPRAADGSSRRPDIEGGSTTGSSVYFEALDANLTRGWAPLTGVISDNWKYIELPEPELYDLAADPAERTNLAAREPARVRALQSRLQQWTTGADVGAARAVAPSDARRLQSLGYISGSAASRSVYRDADDPKRLVAVSEQFNAALDEASSGRVDAALTKFADVLSRRPDFAAARLTAATVLLTHNRPREAVDLLRQAPAPDQKQPAWLTKMGQALAASGALREARDTLAAAAAASAGDPEPLNDLGVVLLRLGESDQARRAFEQLLQIDPSAAGTWYNLALLEMNLRRTDAAAKAFARVVDLDPRNADGWRGLGAAVVASDPARATDAWRRAVELDPRDPDTLYNLGMLLTQTGHADEGASFLRRSKEAAGVAPR